MSIEELVAEYYKNKDEMIRLLKEREKLIQKLNAGKREIENYFNCFENKIKNKDTIRRITSNV